MSSKEDTERLAGMDKSESNTSLLIGEGINSRDGSPTDELEENPPSGSIEEKKDEESAKADEPKETAPPADERGRPPRKPSLRKPSAVARKSSAPDDVSAVSGLTDDAGEDVNLSIRQHSHSVSWEKDKFADLGMPSFGETYIETGNSSSVPPLSPNATTPPPPPPKQRAKNHWAKIKHSVVQKDISMKEVNPLETEAEAAIMRVVDRTRRANAKNTGNILRHVSDEAAEALQDVTPEQNNLSFTRKSSSEEKSVFSSTTATTAKTGRHNRTKTLDNKLFNLANQMMDLQHGAEGGARARTYTGDSTGKRGRLFSGDGSLPENKGSGNSADVLVQNAAVLFRRPLAKKEESRMDVTAEEAPPSPPDLSPQSSSARTPIWAKLSNGSDVKKADGEEFADDPIDSVVEVDVDIETGVVEGGDEGGGKKRFHFRRGAKRLAQATNQDLKEDFDSFWQFLRPRTGSIKFYLLFVCCCVMTPLIMAAAILYYSGGNPGLGREGASTSWFLLFLVRNVVTGTLAKATEVIIIDLLTLHFRVTTRLCGTIFALLLVQSKGWPFIVSAWGVFNFAMNSGTNVFAQHWLYWQGAIELFNATNPSGTITFSKVNYTVNGIAVGLGVVVAVKRLWWGMYLGKRSYRHYGDELAKVIKDMLIVSKVAAWAKDIEKHGRKALKKKGFKSEVQEETLNSTRVANFISSVYTEDVNADVIDPARPTDGAAGKVIDEDKVDDLTGSLTQSQRMRITELLGRWEEPEIVGEEQESVSLASILQFRQMLAYMDEDFPFSLAFGPADSRVSCVESAQAVFSRLMLLTPDEIVLPFDTLAVLAKTRDGDIDTEEMKELIRVFRPQRNGELTCLDFVRSCDQVYKEMRLLRASISNSGQIDHAFEILVNIVFYSIVIIIILVALDLDPLALFVSISGIVLAFAFAVGSASAKFFEGILFILVRRPYDIGDRIAVANPDTPASLDGSPTWFVQQVGLFTTTVRFAATNEVATVANSSFASLRVINAKRSPQANVYVYMKFAVSVPYSRVLIFRKSVESFVKERPREWLALNGFRATRVEHDQGFIEYIIALGHRSSWQDIGVILQSKADVASYCLELAKKLNMRYTAPPLPVNLSMAAQMNVDQKIGDLLPTTSSEGLPSPTPSATMPSSPDVRSISALFKHE